MEKITGLLYIILGLLFVIYPVFSSAYISIIIGLALVFFGISAITTGILIRNNITNYYSYVSILIGLISVMLGIAFMFFLDALSFIVSFQFYIIGFILMVYGILGMLLLDGKKYTILSLVILLLGILIVAVAVFAASQPVLIAIIIGVTLIVDGVFILVMDNSMTLINEYG